MKAREILFVTKATDTPEEGLNYVIYLARTLGKDLRILMVKEKPLSRRFEDLMTALTFAEANEHDTAARYMSSGDDDSEAAARLILLCAEAGVKATLHPGMDDVFSSVKASLTSGTRFDMVVLSHSLSVGRGTLKRLVKTSPLPVVAMAPSH